MEATRADEAGAGFAVVASKVTQSAAANAEESATAAEKLNAQAEQMKGSVDDLVQVSVHPDPMEKLSPRKGHNELFLQHK